MCTSLTFNGALTVFSYFVTQQTRLQVVTVLSNVLHFIVQINKTSQLQLMYLAQGTPSLKLSSRQSTCLHYIIQTSAPLLPATVETTLVKTTPHFFFFFFFTLLLESTNTMHSLHTGLDTLFFCPRARREQKYYAGSTSRLSPLTLFTKIKTFFFSPL